MKNKVKAMALRAIYAVQVWLTGISKNPKCPYCGAPCDTETSEVMYDGDQEDMKCDECGKEFYRFVSFEPEFYTEKVEQ